MLGGNQNNIQVVQITLNFLFTTSHQVYKWNGFERTRRIIAIQNIRATNVLSQPCCVFKKVFKTL